MQEQRFREVLLAGTAVVAVVSLLLPLAHVGAALVVPLLMVGHLVTLNLVLVRDARRLLGARRRLFTRWICRLSFLWIGVPGYGLAAVPLVGVAAGVATFAGLTALSHSYIRWSLERERQRLPLALWETVVLIGLVVLTVLALLVLGGLALVLGWSISKLVGLATT
jgi:hypothetical protein